MSLEGQRLQPDRYALVPRTLTFLIYKDEILLIKVGEDRGAWSGLYNGVGGHVERYEDPYSAALRELREETNQSPESLTLSGVVQIDTKTNPGIMLFVFRGDLKVKRELISGPEGKPEWVKMSDLDVVPLVDDLPHLIPKVLESERDRLPFFAKYHYDPDDQLLITFI